MNLNRRRFLAAGSLSALVADQVVLTQTDDCPSGSNSIRSPITNNSLPP